MNWMFEEGRIYSTDEKGELLAEATLTPKENGVVDIDHTYVAPHLRGNGFAGEMMAVVAQHIREKGLKAVASCSYAKAWLQRNRETYQDIIADEADSQGPCCRIDGKH